MGLSGRDARLKRCKPAQKVSQAHLDWALKEIGTFGGPRDYWEEWQSSRGIGRAYCNGPSSPQWEGSSGVVCKPNMGLKE